MAKEYDLANNKNNKEYKIYAISMIRNDADIVLPFLAQADEFFDKLLIVDVQSTDGTKEAITSFATTNTKIQLYSIDRQEKYQSAIMNRLAQTALSEGADWVFFLDADEFINIDGRGALQQYLTSFPDDVMHLPWINLVPSQYGDCTSFDISQTFFWSGRTSSFSKIALSNLFMANNPNFYIHEGSHCVSRDFTSTPIETTRGGLTLLHLPIRSVDRFKYKMASARKTLLSKHNRLPGEGSHVETISKLIQCAPSFDDHELNSIAANYGNNDNETRLIDPVKEEWPTIKMHDYAFKKIRDVGLKKMGLTDMVLADQAVKWNKSDFAKRSVVSAAIEGEDIKIQPQPIMGSGNLFRGEYAALPASNSEVSSTLNANVIIDALNASFIKVRMLTFSAWAELIPILFCIFSIIRPRRFVELGTHNGMCFFAACQATEVLALDTQCVAVDNWIGDPHASFHSDDVFDQFRANIKNNFPNQFYVKAHFKHALECFDDESIDLLHIDGFHTYSAVKDDFETWLPKMSQNGVVLFHDINVHEREFGVWRLWGELENKYPSFSVMHCHGLGIIYVGRQPSVFVEIMTSLQNNPGYKQIAQTFFELVGHLSIEYRKRLSSVGNAEGMSSNHPAQSEDQIRRLNDEIGRLNDEIGRRDAENKARDASQNLLILENWQRHADNAGSWLGHALQFFQRRRDARIIRESRLFDTEYYVNTYPDVNNANINPILHFSKKGVYQLKNPNAVFNTKNYLLMNKDVLLSRMNPFVHYIKYGREENRSW